MTKPAVPHYKLLAPNPRPLAEGEFSSSTMTSEFTSHSGSGGDFVTGLAESTFGQMNASRLLNPETFRSQDFLQPAIDAIPLFSVFEEERWQATAGCLFVDSAGVNLQGMHHSSSITPPLWLSVPPSLARVHPFVPLLPLELAIILLDAASNLAVTMPALTSAQILASPMTCARSFAGFALLSLVKVAEPVVDDRKPGASHFTR